MNLTTMDFKSLRNFMGNPLTQEAIDRLMAAYKNPTEANWSDACGIQLQKNLTLWQAVRKVDPSFPTAGPQTQNGVVIKGWPRVPTADLLAEAIVYASLIHPIVSY